MAQRAFATESVSSRPVRGRISKGAPVEPLQLGIRLQYEDGIETVDAAVSPHRARRVFEPIDAIDAGADDPVRDKPRREGVREIGARNLRPALDRFLRQSLRGGGDRPRVPLAG